MHLTACVIIYRQIIIQQHESMTVVLHKTKIEEAADWISKRSVFICQYVYIKYLLTILELNKHKHKDFTVS